MAKTSGRPTHPGEILLREFLEPRGILQAELAEHIGEHASNLNKLIHGERHISPRSAWMLGWALGTGPEYWMELQTRLELWAARPQRRVGRLVKGARARRAAPRRRR
jgi:addiction module HigA family antidote